MLAACGEDPTTPPVPAFTVTVAVTATPLWNGATYDGCRVLWRASASDSTTLVRFHLGKGNYEPTVDPPFTGAFIDSGGFYGVRDVVTYFDTTGTYVDPQRIAWDFWVDTLILDIAEQQIRQNHQLAPACWAS